MDEDLLDMSHDELLDEITKLRTAIREHRDSRGHDLCWWHPSLWGALPESSDPLPEVPEWEQFMRGCIQYRASLDLQLSNSPRTNERYEE